MVLLSLFNNVQFQLTHTKFTHSHGCYGVVCIPGNKQVHTPYCNRHHLYRDLREYEYVCLSMYRFCLIPIIALVLLSRMLLGVNNRSIVENFCMTSEEFLQEFFQ